MDLFEHGDYKVLPPEVTRGGLTEYLCSVWDNRPILFSGYEEEEVPEEDELAEIKAKKQRFLKFDGNRVGARNYVGFIQYEGTQINIWPKVYKNIDCPSPGMMTSNLLYWLSYCRRAHFPFAKVSLKDIDLDNLLEAFIYIFAHQALALMQAQPYRCYEEVTEETQVMRGRLEMAPYIHNHLVTGNWHRLHCTYEPSVYDNLFNRIVKRVTSILLQSSRNIHSKAALSELLFILDEVADQACTANDCSKVRFNRLYEDLEVILEMCRMFLENMALSSDREQKQNFCFLLPMEYVFEDFLFGFIEHHFPKTMPESQKSNLYLTMEKVFQMQHDILLNKPKLIIDAKYKLREVKSSDRKAGIHQGDLYQQVSYAFRRGIQDVLLLYPSYDENPMHTNFTVEGRQNSEKINIRAVNLKICDDDLRRLEEGLKKEIVYALNK